MKKLIRRIIIIVCAVMLIGALATMASAADETSGTWGDLNWSYANNTLTITGTGPMPNSVSSYTYTYPWSAYSSRITDLVVGKGVTTVGNAVFQKMTTLTNVTLSSTVTTIGDNAFNGCTNLRSITIPNSVTLIDERAFSGCTNLRTVKFGTGLKTICYSAFANCTSLTNLTFPANLETIDWEAFYGCSNLTTISFNNKLKTIGAGAFQDCIRLTAVEIPSSVTDMQTGSNFKGCSSLKTAVVNTSGKLGNRAFENCAALTSVAIADTVTEIGEYAFMNCPSLPEITIPASVQAIRISAFQNCKALKSVKLNEGLESISQWVFAYTAVESIKIPESVTEMQASVFYGCTALTSAEIGEGMSYVPANAFYGCTALKSVKLGRFISEIRQYAFYGCESLSSVAWPEFLTAIKSTAFGGCKSLTSVNLPDGVNYIDYNAFDGCTGLEKVTIPGSIISIGSNTFLNCKNLKTVKFEGNAPSIDTDAFRYVTADVYYPCDNGTWTESVMKQYGGTLNWIGYAPMQAPTISVTNVASTGKPKISWSKVDGAVKYEFYWASSQNGTYTKIATTSNTYVINNSAKAGKQYYYKVTAVAADGTKSEFSNIVTRTCDLLQPVVSVTNVASTGKVKLSWEKIEGAAKYELYWAASKNGTYTKIATTANTSIINNSAKAGKQYYYKVRALHGTNTSAHSAYSEIVTRSCDLAQPVVTATNVASTGKVKLSWKAVEGAAKYELYRATSKDGTYTKIGSTANTYITNTSGVAGTTYYYKVRALHGTNTGAHSAYSSIVTRTCDLAQPTLTVELNSKGQPVLTWSKVEGATKYQVYRATSKNGTYSLIYTTTSGTSVTNKSNLVAGTTYYYKVIAIHSKSAANSAYSAIKSITVK